MQYKAFEVILLAAGTSARMGAQNKLLIEIEGTPLVRASAEVYCKLAMPVTVVLGHQADAIKAALHGLPIKTILNTDYATGQANSIRAGLAAASLNSKALIIALADQPLLESTDISALCEAFLKSPRDKILRPYFKGQRGNPALIPPAIAKHLITHHTLPRDFMDQNPQRLAQYAAPNNHFTTDLDTPADLTNLLGGR